LRPRFSRAFEQLAERQPVLVGAAHPKPQTLRSILTSA
jgi:hypothetical protein